MATAASAHRPASEPPACTAASAKTNRKTDLALIYSDTPCAAAAVYTQNLVKGAPIYGHAAKILPTARAQAVLCNSGNANTCNADGAAVARRMCELAASACGLDPRDVIVASTGVIGQRLDISPIEASIGALKDALSATGSRDAAEAHYDHRHRAQGGRRRPSPSAAWNAGSAASPKARG